MAERLVHINDLLPPVISGDPEVKVTRQRGITHEGAAVNDPFADLPVIQVDPEIEVTRQKGIVHVDAGAGVVRMDRPAPPAGSDPKAPSLAGLHRADRPVGVKEAQVSLGNPNVPSFHEPVQGGAEKVGRQGIKTAAQAEKHLAGEDGVHKADSRAPGVQISPELVTEGGRRGGMTPELAKAYAQNKVVASDTPSKDLQTKPVSFADQQMKPEAFQPMAGGSVQASRRSAAGKAPAKKRSTKRRVRAGHAKPAARPASVARPVPSVETPGAKAPEAAAEEKVKE
jgi:hypothetical protein